MRYLVMVQTKSSKRHFIKGSSLQLIQNILPIWLRDFALAWWGGKILMLSKGELGLSISRIYWRSVFQKQIIRWNLASQISIMDQYLWKNVGGSKISKREESNCKTGPTMPWPTPSEVLDMGHLNCPMLGQNGKSFGHTLSGGGSLQ